MVETGVGIKPKAVSPEKKVKRPKLSSLRSTADISEWLPDLKREIDFYLKQTEVPCYTEKKISECQRHILRLEKEYKAFVMKMRKLDSSTSVVPWTARPYKKHKKCVSDLPILHPVNGNNHCIKISELKTPVLVHDRLYQSLDLQTEEPSLPSVSQLYYSPPVNKHVWAKAPSHINAELITDEDPHFSSDREVEVVEEYHTTISKNEKMEKAKYKEKGNILGLCYSSSEEEMEK